MVGLADSAREPMSELSGGQLRRLFIAQALVHDPSLLVLDEPTAGLDPLARVELRELVGETREGRIVVMSTHLIEDVAHLSGQVLVLDAGRQVWRGSAAELGSVTHDTGHGSDRLGSAEEIGFIRLFEHADGEDQ
jgi:ABC-2 type transport system ATP-binding protein